MVEQSKKGSVSRAVLNETAAATSRQAYTLIA